MADIGVFCETYGNTINNRVLEYLLENQDLDFAVGDMAEELGISRPKAYGVIKEFEDKWYVRKSRTVGNTQLYMLNKDDARVNLFLRDFRECLRLAAEEHSEKPAHTSRHEVHRSKRLKRSARRERTPARLSEREIRHMLEEVEEASRASAARFEKALRNIKNAL